MAQLLGTAAPPEATHSGSTSTYPTRHQAVGSGQWNPFCSLPHCRVTGQWAVGILQYSAPVQGQWALGILPFTALLTARIHH